ncbi:hypothetical protein [Bacteriophage sp.]|nr:hypothetical protein [Bacteriophage sp.]
MRKLLFVITLLLSFSLLAFAQDVKPITISAEQMATLELPRLRARVAALEAEKATKIAQEADKAATDALIALLEKAGVKKDDLSKYDVTQANDGGLILKLKEEKK